MTTMVLELCDALRELGASEAKARSAAEAVVGDPRSVTRMDARFDRLDAEASKTNARFDGIDERLDKVDARFDRLDTRLDRMDARFSAVGLRLETMRGESILVRWMLGSMLAFLVTIVLKLFLH